MSDPVTVKVGSRKSQLALIQTEFVVGKLKEMHPELNFEIVSMSTVGDKVLDRALSKIGEKSLFTKELEIALEQKVVDFVVHSLKDLPTSLPDGMAIAAVLERDDPRDAVVYHPQCQQKKLETLPENSVIGTSSLRRVAQLKRRYPRLQFESIRGNLNTRLKKLDDGDQYTAIVLANAGLTRMGWHNRIDQILDPDVCMYAVSQGALGVECRADDETTIKLLSELSHRETLLRCVAERSFLKRLEGGCTVPIAVHTTLVNSETASTYLEMCGGVFSLDGSEAVTSSLRRDLPHDTRQSAAMDENYAGIVSVSVDRGQLEAALQLGLDLAAELLNRGAKPILDTAKDEHKKEQERLKTQTDQKQMPKWSNLDSQAQ